MARVAWSEHKIPGPPAQWLFGARGNMTALRRDPFGTLKALYQTYGPVAGLVGYHSPVVVALGPDATRQLLAAPGLSHPPLLRLAEYGERGVPRFARAPLLPAATERQQEVWHANTVTSTEQLVRRWVIGRELDGLYTMMTLLSRIVCRTLLGPMADDQMADMLVAWRRLTHVHSLMSLQVPPHPLFSLPFRRLHRPSSHLVSSIRRLLASMQARTTVPADSGGPLIQLDEYHACDEDTLLEQIVLLLVAGEAAGSALAWTLFLLSQRPQLLADVRDQLSNALHGAAPALEQLGQLSLLNDIVNESLRLLPPLAIAYCRTTTSVELAGHTLPPDTTIVYSPFVSHRDASLYLWPDAFRPERWRSITPEPHQYLPFGAHPELVACAPLVSMLIKLVLAIVVQHASLGLAPGARIDLDMRLTLVSRAGLPMVIAPRDRLVTRRLPEGNIHSSLRIR